MKGTIDTTKNAVVIATTTTAKEEITIEAAAEETTTTTGHALIERNAALLPLHQVAVGGQTRLSVTTRENDDLKSLL